MLDATKNVSGQANRLTYIAHNRLCHISEYQMCSDPFGSSIERTWKSLLVRQYLPLHIFHLPAMFHQLLLLHSKMCSFPEVWPMHMSEMTFVSTLDEKKIRYNKIFTVKGNL